MGLSRLAWAVIVIGLALVAAAWWAGLARQNFGVSMESRSMSHADVDLEGVLDPGEQIAIVPVRSREDVVTAVEAQGRGPRVGDDWGDVILFTDPGRGVGIAHRALVWVEWDAASGAYDVPSLGLEDVRSFLVPDVGTWVEASQTYERGFHRVDLDPDTAGRHDGFVTKGDHNVPSDQDANVAGGPSEIVQVSRIEGKVAGFLEPHETMRVAAYVGIATLALGAVIVVGRRAGWHRRLARPRGGGCRACGRPLPEGASFCVACGADR